MINLKHNQLEIRFPEVHRKAGVKIDFKRTLRVPDDSETHYLPPDLGRFPLRHIEDFDLKHKKHLKKRGGVIMPMFQADALWINFTPLYEEGYDEEYPIAIKIGTGKICAISGDKWNSSLNRDPQDYITVPGQPWLDGYNADKNGAVRQFVAAPLGKGLTVEEQLTGSANVGGIQIQAFPLKLKKYKDLMKARSYQVEVQACYSAEPSLERRESFDMGLAPGGSIKQDIYEDEYDLEDWDLRNTQRCFVTLANATQWMDLTCEAPPRSPNTEYRYKQQGLPWFDYYDKDREAIDTAVKLGKVKSPKELGASEEDPIWDEELLHHPKTDNSIIPKFLSNMSKKKDKKKWW
jgi:hypothetical protein